MDEKSLILIFVYISPAINGHYAWCGRYDTFCLFSYVGKIQSSEAQKSCSDIKSDSRIVSVVLGDDRVNDVAKEFIRNHSIANNIFHSFLQKGVEEKEDFEKKSMDLVICMTNCQANWTDMDQKAMDGANMTHHSNIKTIQECKALCEVNISCSSIDWIHGTNMRGCWLNKYPYHASGLYENSKASHHVVDRTVKTVDRCIGKGFMTWPLPEVTVEPCQTNIMNFIPWVLFAISTAALVFVTFLHLKRGRDQFKHFDQNEHHYQELNMEMKGNKTLSLIGFQIPKD